MFQIIRKLKWAYYKFRFSYYLPFIVLISYTLIGAVMFRNLELEADRKRRADYRNSTEYAFNQVLKRIMAIRCHDTEAKVDPEQATRHAKEALFWFIDYLNLTQIIEERVSNTPWTWMGSAFYSGQLYTTIGYGYPTVSTSTGQVATIFYIMFGIPMFLLIVKDVGKHLSRFLRKIYKRWRTAKNKIPDNAVRRMSEPVKAIYSLTGVGNGNSSPTKSVTEITSSTVEAGSPTQLKPTTTETTIEPINEVKQNETNQKLQNGIANFPIPLAVFILAAWISLCAALFCIWETEWGYLTSVYFFFVSISTVGLGDIVPQKPDMMLINFILILVGLALLSMVVNLIQDAIEKIIQQLIQDYVCDMVNIAQIVSVDNEFQLIQDYVCDMVNIAQIVSVDNEFVEETASPFEVGMSADLLTAPLTAFSREHEPWYRGISRKAKDWMADIILDSVIVRQLKDDDSSSEEEEEEEMEIVIDDEKKPSIRDTVSFGSRKKKKLFRKRGNFTLNMNLQTLRAIQAMEKVKLNTKKDNSFRGRLFAKFATNKDVGKFFDNHVAEPAPCHTGNISILGTIIGESQKFDVGNPPTPWKAKLVTPEPTIGSPAPCHTGNISILGTIIGEPQKFDVGNPPTPWKAKLVTPEPTIGSVKGSIGTISTYDLDSLDSLAYHDLTFGYSTDSVPRLIEQEQKQLQEEQKRERFRQRRASKTLPPLPPAMKEIVVTPPPLAETDEPVIKIEVNRSSDSPEANHYALDPGMRNLLLRRSSSPGFGLPAPSLEIKTKMPMVQCPSCLHLATAPSATNRGHSHADDVDAMKRIQNICGILPADFSPIRRRSTTKSISPTHSHFEDSGYDNSLATDSLMTDSILTGASLTASLLKNESKHAR
uniref:Potassium channel domain-containing protein n=1 Tax=Panagrolaimus sp. JU765 TaxID=591449 RepID=A0AC34QR38_9BILA